LAHRAWRTALVAIWFLPPLFVPLILKRADEALNGDERLSDEGHALANRCRKIAWSGFVVFGVMWVFLFSSLNSIYGQWTSIPAGDINATRQVLAELMKKEPGQASLAVRSAGEDCTFRFYRDADGVYLVLRTDGLALVAKERVANYFEKVGVSLQISSFAFPDATVEGEFAFYGYHFGTDSFGASLMLNDLIRVIYQDPGWYPQLEILKLY